MISGREMSARRQNEDSVSAMAEGCRVLSPADADARSATALTGVGADAHGGVASGRHLRRRGSSGKT